MRKASPEVSQMLDELAKAKALQEISDLVDMLNSPGWALLLAEWERMAAEYDGMLHRENVENVARMAALQTTCRVLSEVQRTPDLLLANRQALLREVGPFVEGM